MYGTVKIKEVLYLMDKELGTSWRSGTAAEIIATIEAFATAIEMTASMSMPTLSVTGASPGTQTASTVVFGQKDSSTQAKATLDFETEEAVVTEASTPDTTIRVWVNGVEYKWPLEAV